MFEDYAAYESFMAKLQLVCFMLGMGATLTVADFARILQQPRSLLAGLVVQLLLTPLLAYGFVQVLDFDEQPQLHGIAVGLLLVAAMPGGTLSKAFTYLSRGNVALSISMTACAIIASIVTVPLVLRFLAWEYIPAEFHMPLGDLVVEVAVCMLVPLLVGMAVNRFTSWHELFSKSFIRLGFAVMLVYVSSSLLMGRIRPAEYGWQIPLAIILFCVASQQLSMLPFRLLGWPPQDTVAVGIEVTMRNINLALLLKELLFPGADPVSRGVLFVILNYGAVAFVAGVPLSVRMRRVIRRQQSDSQG